ncbi:MAG TPA: DUF4258 domain-containing protein [Kofleriaceae bacterium]|nr:DUF4258 domain-containing protein [Kofleriaceae bacterium]
MHDPSALAEIHRLAHLNRIAFSTHAQRRLAERGAEREDVRVALTSSTSASRQDRGTWRVAGGRDRAGDELTVIVDIEADVIVVTIF